MNREQALNTARILRDALPYIRAFTGKTMVIKLGGNAVAGDALSDFAHDVTLLRLVGIRPVVTHGGGPQIASMLRRLNIESQFVDGLRVTDQPTMDVVEMVLSGPVNRTVVDAINRAGGRAAGLSGNDDLCIQASSIDAPLTARERKIDMGRVGKVSAVRTELLTLLTGSGCIPVVAPLGVDADGALYNVNADAAASALAGGLKAEKLILLSDVQGVQDDDGRLMRTLDEARAQELIDAGTAQGGMRPKLECALAALRSGVRHVHIIDGREPHALLLELFTDRGIGSRLELSLPSSTSDSS